MMRQLRTVAKMWYRADHVAANPGCALVAGYPAGLLKACGVSPGAIASGKASGGDLVVAWANEWGYLLEPGEDLRADRARAVLLTSGGTYRCTLEFAPDTPDGWFVPPGAGGRVGNGDCGLGGRRKQHPGGADVGTAAMTVRLWGGRQGPTC